jgi:glycosyltransferase involved in cell wall biosynthesis
MDPLVSILIPAYNAGEALAETVESALAQTWPNKEIIVVDDGSKDNTLAIARQFASRGVTVITQKNQGAAATRNNAFASSRGDFIQWLDADDLLVPGKIMAQMRALEKCGSKRKVMSGPWGRFIYRPEKAKFVPSDLWADLSVVEWMARKMEQNLHMQTATWLASRELTQAAGPWDTRLLSDDDGEFFARVLMAGDGICFVPDAKVFYRISGPGCLSYIGKSDRKMEAQFLSMEINIKYIRSLEDSGRVRKACLIYLQNWLSSFYPERLDIVEKARQLAATLGGKLDLPRLSWKYSWIKSMFGWRSAKEAQLRYNKAKLSMARSWDKALFELGQRNLSAAGLPAKSASR